MTTTLYSWTVIVDIRPDARDGTQMPPTVTIDAATSATVDGGTLWQLLGADGRPVYEVPVGRLISARKGPALSQAAGAADTVNADACDTAPARIMQRVIDGKMSIDAARRALGLEPFGLPETGFVPVRVAHIPDGPVDSHGRAVSGDSTPDALLTPGRMTGDELLAELRSLGEKAFRDRAEAQAPPAFSDFTKTWGEACVKAWDDGFREPSAVLPDFLWPKVAQLVNPVTRNVVTIKRTDPFPASLPGHVAEPLAEMLDRLMGRARTGENAEASIHTVTHVYTIKVTAAPKDAVFAKVAADDSQGAPSAVLNVTSGNIMSPEDVQKLAAKISETVAQWAGHERRTPATPDINTKGAAFAAEHGSFDLWFDAAQNPASPDYRPWTLTPGGSTAGWGGLTAEEAIESAATGLGGSGAGSTEDPR